MKQPPEWTEFQLEADRAKAIEIFRRQRMEEPLEQYIANFDEYQGVVEELLETTVDLSDLKELREVLTTPKLLEAFRYLAGPPISEDDLAVLAESILSRKQLSVDSALVARVGQIVVSGLDRRRFPWVIDGREPTETERASAVVASAALIATRRSETNRRSGGKRLQEESVRAALRAHKFTQVPSRKVSTNLSQAPGSGEFCAESLLGNRKADVLVRLWDHRVMPIECKVSNSSTNSVKRLNNDAARKAETWKHDFGSVQIVPAAVLGGVYKLHNLVDAQTRGLAIFWAHDLKALTDWIDETY